MDFSHLRCYTVKFRWPILKNTIEYLGEWEMLYNPDFNCTEFGTIIYASEANVLNVAMFGMTAKQWREANSELKGNIRDYATINELICLSNMENLNAVFIELCRKVNASSNSTK